MAVCQVCQHDNPAGAEFCEECGAALTSAGSPAMVPPASGQPAPSPIPPAPETVPAPEGAPAPEATPPPAPGPKATPPPTSEPIDSGGSAANVTPKPSGEPMPAAPAEGTAQSTTGGEGTAQSTTAAVRPRLVAMRYGAPAGEEIPLMGQRVVVGRFDPETGPVDIDLSSTPESVHISRQHAELYQEDGRWMVRDLGSTNGVFVKGSGDSSFGPRITAPRSLAAGDEVAFGNSRFVFQAD